MARENLVDDALSKVGELGVVGAMKWLADSISAAPAAAVVTVDTPEFRELRQAFEAACFEAYDRDIDTSEMTASRVALLAHIDAHTAQAVAHTTAKYNADILALYDRQREDGNTIAALKEQLAAAPQQHAQAALSDGDVALILDGLKVAGVLIDMIPTRLQEYADDTIACIGELVNVKGGYNAIASAKHCFNQFAASQEPAAAKPNVDCSGDPSNCPDNEGNGCACDPMNSAAAPSAPEQCTDPAMCEQQGCANPRGRCEEAAPATHPQEASWKDALRRSGANTDYHGYIAFTGKQLENFVQLLAPSPALPASSDADDTYLAKAVFNLPPMAQKFAKGAQGDALSQAADALDAARWRGFIGSARIKPQGSAGLESSTDPYGNPYGNYAHMGLEIWITYSRDFKSEMLEQMDKTTELGRKWLTAYADVAIRALAANKGEQA